MFLVPWMPRISTKTKVPEPAVPAAAPHAGPQPPVPWSTRAPSWNWLGPTVAWSNISFWSMFLAGVWYCALWWRVVDFAHGRARRWGFLHLDTRKMKTWFTFWTRFLHEGCRFCQKKSRKRVHSSSCSSEGGVGLGGVGWGGDDTTPVSCYATWSSLALDATPLDLLCYATWSSLALDATPLDL